MINLFVPVALANSRIVFLQYDRASLYIVTTSLSSCSTSVLDFSPSRFHPSPVLCSTFLPISLCFPSPLLSFSIMDYSNIELGYIFIYEIS